MTNKLRELGFGNQAIIVGTKRKELFSEVDKLLATALEEQKQKHLGMIKNAHQYATTSIEKKTLKEVMEMITGEKFVIINRKDLNDRT